MSSSKGLVRIIPGQLAYSDFRLVRLANQLGAEKVQAVWVHYVKLKRILSGDEQSILHKLLDHDTSTVISDPLHRDLLDALSSKSLTNAPKTALFYVTPRPGTITPWSSKATNIAHVCNLYDGLQRIERGMVIAATFDKALDERTIPNADCMHDRMTHTISRAAPELDSLFAECPAAPATIIPLKDSKETAILALNKAGKDMGLALDPVEVDYLADTYMNQIKRDPVDVEIFMFAQVNSEHCRHKQFNAEWTINGNTKPHSLFAMIRNTYQKNPGAVISAYSDNAAVLRGEEAAHWAPNILDNEWTETKEAVHYLSKVETHNHPTAVSPFPGAATGSGGEIRDEGAVGQGSRPKAGLAGFNVSNLLIPGFTQPWEKDIGKPDHISSSLQIMLEAPIGAAAFNNEFGRPCTSGYFRTMLATVDFDDGSEEYRGYHKPIMIAGGLGTVRPQHAQKMKELMKAGAKLVVIGGPAMLIGLGGGAASSVHSSEDSVTLDFASVQRGNAEVQRRAQEVIDACTAMGSKNPILSIHDVGAGGLSNAFPELVHDAGFGATFELREIDNADSGMSPLQIWCCEAQERYVLAIDSQQLDAFKRLCSRERCGYSVVGTASDETDHRLVLTDRDSKGPNLIDLPMSTLFGDPPRLKKSDNSKIIKSPDFDSSLLSYLPQMPAPQIIHEAILRILTFPAVGSKSFLITIADRTVGGLTTRDQMVGPWQTPVSDVSVSATALIQGAKTGEAMAMGERPALAIASPAASARMAVGEALTNLAASHCVGGLERITLSANWMAACNHPGEGAALYEAVEAIGLDLCPKLDICIPVGKDSTSMKMKWTEKESKKGREVTSPVSLIISAFAPANIKSTWTPTLRRLEDVGESTLFFVDLAQGSKAMGSSSLAQVFEQIGRETPNVRDADVLRDFFDAVGQLHESGVVLAYHDRSDGGLFTTLVEMMFAGRCGLEIMLDEISQSNSTGDIIEALFNEELGAVFQVRKKDENEFRRCFATCGPPPGMIKKIGRVPPTSRQEISLIYGAEPIYQRSRKELQQHWAATSYHMQKLRDNPMCAESEYENILDDEDPGLHYHLTYKPKDNVLPLTTAFSSLLTAKPRVAILREQGINGHAEMAFAFHSAGFSAIDVHMTDILAGRVSLSSFVGLAACGGFSYGDVLGAGQGWAKSVLFHEDAKVEFRNFFQRPDTFTLGVCNGCQFLSKLKAIIPGIGLWPSFERNESEQYEARVCMVKVNDPEGSKSSVFLHGMHGSMLPVATAHGEGRAVFTSESGTNASAAALQDEGLASLQFVDNRLQPTERYPYNPNGSASGITGVRSKDGRVLAIMPHPERTILREVASYIPSGELAEWGPFGPWVRLFKNARRWVG